MLRTNQEKLPIISVEGRVAHPGYNGRGYYDPDGQMDFLVGTGGITYNAKIGDNAIDWAADHLEPGVTIKNPVETFNNALATYACIGNGALVISGEGKGSRGLVTGKHGGVEHLMVYFEQEALEQLAIDDRIAIKAWGQGLRLLDYPEVLLRSLSPQLLEKLEEKELLVAQGKKLQVGVAHILPAMVMGAGLGSGNGACGDYDITMFDQRTIEKYALHTLRFGDLVAITDSDTRYGRTYRAGAVTIGVVVHSDSRSAGHGPGVTTLLSCKTNQLQPMVAQGANLADLFLSATQI